MKKLAPNHVAFPGKGSREQILPNRHAMNTLTKGDPVQRSLNNYAAQTPSGAGALDDPSLIPSDGGSVI